MKKMMKNRAKKMISSTLLAIFIMAAIFQSNLQTATAATPLNDLMNQYVGTTWNGNYYGIQCKGFANYIFYRLWDVRYIGPYNSSKYYIPNPSGAYEVGRIGFNDMSVQSAKNLLSSGKPGDFIQVRRRNKSYGHSMILAGVDSNGVTVFDCNSDGRNGVKKYHVTWQSFYNKNSAMSLYRANNNRATSHTQPTQNTNTQNVPAQPQTPSALPSITNVGIDDIDFSHIDLHFAANNAALARVVFQSRNTGQSVTRDYISGLDRISLNFSLLELPRTTEMNILIYAYSTTNGGNETLHRVLYGNIPGVVQLPQGDQEIADICFDYIFYADNNDDLRMEYGYDREKLLNHWNSFGKYEGRAGSAVYHGAYYLEANPDVKAAYGNNYEMAYKHFLSYGSKEKRPSSEYYNGTYYQNKYNTEMGGFDSKQLLFHFKNFGLGEGRVANTAKYNGRSSWRN